MFNHLFKTFTQGTNEFIPGVDFRCREFNMVEILATKAALNPFMLAYSLMSLMQQVQLKTSAVKCSSNSVSAYLKNALR